MWFGCSSQVTISKAQQGNTGGWLPLLQTQGALLPQEATPASHHSFMFPSKGKTSRSTKFGSFTLFSTVISGLKKTTGMLIKSLNCHSQIYRMLRNFHFGIKRE